jgi:hypothetical protein
MPQKTKKKELKEEDQRNQMGKKGQAPVPMSSSNNARCASTISPQLPLPHPLTYFSFLRTAL